MQGASLANHVAHARHQVLALGWCGRLNISHILLPCPLLSMEAFTQPNNSTRILLRGLQVPVS